MLFSVVNEFQRFGCTCYLYLQVFYPEVCSYWYSLTYGENLKSYNMCMFQRVLICTINFNSSNIFKQTDLFLPFGLSYNGTANIPYDTHEKSKYTRICMIFSTHS
jgi:hypothetical protein